MSAIILDGKLLHYESFGRGRPLIFIHGWLGSWRYWVPTMEIMSEHCRTYALDLWGFGDSERLNGQYSIQGYVSLLNAFVEEMGFRSVTLIGHALGAIVVMHYATNKSDCVERIMTVSAPFTGEAINQRLLNSGTTFLNRVMGWTPSEGHAEVERGMNKTAEGVIGTSLRSIVDADLRHLVHQIRVPLLLTHGEKDVVVAPPQTEWLAAVGDNVRAIMLPNSRHFPMLDDTSVFTRLLHDFLEVNDAEQLATLALKEEWRRRTH